MAAFCELACERKALCGGVFEARSNPGSLPISAIWFVFAGSRQGGCDERSPPRAPEACQRAADQRMSDLDWRLWSYAEQADRKDNSAGGFCDNSASLFCEQYWSITELVKKWGFSNILFIDKMNYQIHSLGMKKCTLI